MKSLSAFGAVNSRRTASRILNPSAEQDTYTSFVMRKVDALNARQVE